MIERINSILDIFDVGDLKFFYLVAKKNIKNLILLSLIISILALFISSNQQKKYLSKGIIVIEPEDNNIVNIEEVYSIESRMNRINNQMAILKSDEVLEYIIKDKKNSVQFKKLYSQGLSISTPLKINYQIQALKSLRKGIEDYDKRRGWRGPITNKLKVKIFQ